MMIIGCDFHPSWQQVSWLDTETGESGEQKLVQASGDAERFYRQVAAPALIGMEATGNCHWLVDLLSELGHELWVGDAAQIRASYVRQQKTDKRDAIVLRHTLNLFSETFVACRHLHSMFRFDTALRSLIESNLLLGNSDPDSELGRILGLPLHSLKFAPWRRSSGGQSNELSSLWPWPDRRIRD